jgi:alpha,alpha-trehalase
MRIAAALCLALMSSAAAGDAALDPPQVRFTDLFAAVQMAQIFADGKSFADATANRAPAQIMQEYRAAPPATPAALRAFVDAHFVMPPPAAAVFSPPQHVSLARHIDSLWSPLTRESREVPAFSSLLPLPAPFVVPGGRFREMYYWDSFFTMLGLRQSGRAQAVADMVRDFAFLIDTYGHVPNGARSYYLSRSQPPFFFAMVALTGPDAARAWANFLPQLQREYEFWMEGAATLAGSHPAGRAHRRVVAMPDGAILNRYWDDRDTPRDESYREDVELAGGVSRPPADTYRDIRAAAESGWDFSSRWFADGRTRATIHTTEVVPVDLNALLFGLENAIRSGCARQHDRACAKLFATRAAARRRAMDQYLWNEQRGTYLDFDFKASRPIPYLSAATVYPLFVQAASSHQAAATARAVQAELLQAGGLASTSLTTGEQWDAPNGWAPLQWLAISGLRHYGQRGLASQIACRWLRTVGAVYEQRGKLVEKYDVIDLGRVGGGGEYPLQDGFGWTNGVTRALLDLYPRCAEIAR